MGHHWLLIMGIGCIVMLIAVQVAGYITMRRMDRRRAEYRERMNGRINREDPCGHCGLRVTREGHDGCLGTLPGVMNACCGHGRADEAYVQFPDGTDLRGQDALNWIKQQETK